MTIQKNFRMVVKRLELCHYQSMEQIVEITKNIAQNFKEIIHQFLTISRFPALKILCVFPMVAMSPYCHIHGLYERLTGEIPCFWPFGWVRQPADADCVISIEFYSD